MEDLWSPEWTRSNLSYAKSLWRMAIAPMERSANLLTDLRNSAKMTRLTLNIKQKNVEALKLTCFACTETAATSFMIKLQP